MDRISDRICDKIFQSLISVIIQQFLIMNIFFSSSSRMIHITQSSFWCRVQSSFWVSYYLTKNTPSKVY